MAAALRAWGAGGGDPRTFWQLTPWQARTWLEGRALRVDGQQKAMLAQAWHGATFHAAVQVGQLPPLYEVLGERPKVSVGQQMAAVLRAKGWTEE